MPLAAVERLASHANLNAIWKDYWPRAKRSAPGADGVTAKQFQDDLPHHLEVIRRTVRSGYRYSPLRGIPVPKKNPAKFRMICVPTFQDRLIQRALLQEIELKAKQLRISNDVSYGFVKDSDGVKRGTSAARAAAVGHRQARPWAFKADISAFFDQISRADLTQRFDRAFQRKSLLPLVRGAIGCEVDERRPDIRRILKENGIVRGQGLRQGMPLSPILSNFVLRDFDAAFVSAGYDLVRYADDLIVLASSEDECKNIEAFTRAELFKLGLKVSETKTEICSPETPVEFLGMELGLDPRTSKYRLTISSAQMAKIKERFTVYHCYGYAIKEHLTLPDLLQRLDNMKSGYRAAYRSAHNFDDFQMRMEQWVENCVRAVYSSIFGKEVINSLQADKRRFLMIR